jgi:hypothetical protein
MGGLVVVVVKFKNRLEIWQSFVMDVCAGKEKEKQRARRAGLYMRSCWSVL